jgi:hypothetical protein
VEKERDMRGRREEERKRKYFPNQEREKDMENEIFSTTKSYKYPIP